MYVDLSFLSLEIVPRGHRNNAARTLRCIICPIMLHITANKHRQQKINEKKYSFLYGTFFLVVDVLAICLQFSLIVQLKTQCFISGLISASFAVSRA